MRKLQSSQRNGLWLVTGGAIIWGTIGIATQLIFNTDSTTSLFINLARLLVATPVLMVVCWRVVGRTMFSIHRRDLLIIILSGTLVAISQSSYFAAIRSTGVTIATLLTVCVSPLIVTCFSVLLKFEILTRRIVFALVCALIGSVLLVGLHAPEGTHDNLLVGGVFSLISALSYAGFIICGRFLAADYHSLQITAITFCVATVVLGLTNLVSGIIPVHTTQGWLLVLYLGLIPTAFAYWLFQAGLRSVSATTASIASLLEPTVGALLAWLLFSETLPATGIVGAGLLVLSILCLSIDRSG